MSTKVEDVKDVKDIALKLNEIKVHCPEDYFYLKGWIHGLLQKENKERQSRKEPRRSA